MHKDLRELIKFMYDRNHDVEIYTSLSDAVLNTKEGDMLDPGYDFEDYKLKVNRYIEEHHNSLAIYKPRNNIPLTKMDYQVLSDILTKQLGNEEDYKREYQDLPFGLLVRKIAKLDHEAAMKVFNKERQKKIIQLIEQVKDNAIEVS